MTTPARGLVSGQRRLLLSPAWFVPYDDFRRRRTTTGFRVDLDRWDGARWVRTDVRPVVTPRGVVAYPGLGRRREPWTAEPELYRAIFRATGSRALYPADGEPFDAAKLGKEFLAYPYDDDHPPQVLAEPEPVRLLPDPTFEYPAATRVVHGVVRRAGSAAPIENALIEAAGQTGPDMQDWRERALSGVDGVFRLSLRWAGRGASDTDPVESFTLTATERPGHTGQVDIRLPGDLGTPHVIEISD